MSKKKKKFLKRFYFFFREPSLRVSSRMSNRSGYTHRTHNSQQQRSQSNSGQQQQQQQQQFNSNRLSVPNQRVRNENTKISVLESLKEMQPLS